MSTRVLLVTNDFPPRRGGIQSYLENLVTRLAATGDHDIAVYAPQWKGAQEYDARAANLHVVRHPTSLMLPVPSVERRMRGLIREHDAEVVWFGAAAPLALLGPSARRAGAGRVVASTHGHEVGWSMLPGARSALRRIGDGTDVITYISRYTRARFAGAFGPHAAFEHLPPGVDPDTFRPDPAARAELRVGDVAAHLDVVLDRHERIGYRVRMRSGVLPANETELEDLCTDWQLYRQRHKIENMFRRLKDWRRIHTRYDRCAHTFMSAICIAATVIFWINQ